MSVRLKVLEKIRNHIQKKASTLNVQQIAILRHFYWFLLTQTTDEELIKAEIERTLQSLIIEAFYYAFRSSIPPEETPELPAQSSELSPVPELAEASLKLENYNNTSLVFTTIGDALGYMNISKTVIHHIAAEHILIAQAFQEFIMKVYRQGLREVLVEHSNPTLEGKIGDCHLSVGQDFINQDEVVGIHFTLTNLPRKSAYFLLSGNRNAQTGRNFKIGIVTSADFRITFNLIHEVIDNWPREKEKQK